MNSSTMSSTTARVGRTRRASRQLADEVGRQLASLGARLGGGLIDAQL